MTNEKTHWMQNPNKNYLGHWDLPNGEDVILTIAKASWEEVKNPITGSSAEKRIIRFAEDYQWLKPFICNETNAKMICKVTAENFMEDTVGKKIKLFVSATRVMKEEVDCIRVRNIKSSELGSANINSEQGIELTNLAKRVGFDIEKVCAAYKINTIIDLPSSKFNTVKKGLESKGGSSANS